MTDEPVPVVLGTAGLVGRTFVQRPAEELEQPDSYDEDGNPVWATPRAAGKAIPSNCLRSLNSPLPPNRGGGCDTQCSGRQYDNSCLCDIVRAANAAGVDWSFEVDVFGFWVYDGEPIPEMPDPGGAESAKREQPWGPSPWR